MNPFAFTRWSWWLPAALLWTLTPARAASCDPPPPILAGNWALKSLEAVNHLEGDDGIQVTRGDIVVASQPGPGVYLVVDCAGNVTGAGSQIMSGELVTTAGAMGFGTKVTTTYSGSDQYTFTGKVTGGGATPLALDLVVRSQAGSITATTSVEGPIPFSFSDTSPTKDRVVNEHLPVKFYDPQAGILELDLSQGSWFQQMQAMADQLDDQHLSITYTGGGTYEFATPSITSVTPAYRKVFLREVPINNTYKATVDWRGLPPGTVTFNYPSQPPPQSVPAVGATAPADFDMRHPGGTMVVTAESGGVQTDPFTVQVVNVDVPPWAGSPSDWRAEPGVVYHTTKNWPNTQTISDTISSIPIVGGIWGFTSRLSSELKMSASSEGGETKDKFKVEFNFNYAIGQKNLTLEGDTYTTLDEAGLRMHGDAHIRLPPIRVEEHIGIGDLLPGVESAACHLDDDLCAFVRGIGLTGKLEVNLSGDGEYHGAGSDILWDNGSASAQITVSAEISLFPPPVSDVIAVRLDGSITGCLEMQFHPTFEVTKLGGNLDFSAEVSIFDFFGFNYHPNPILFGDPCPGTAPATTRIERQAIPAPLGSDEIPADGRPAFAFDAQGRAAMAWSARVDGKPRPAGDIRVCIHDGNAWGPSIAVTDDVPMDRAPSLAFDLQGNLVVAWTRNAATQLPASFAELVPFRTGCEIQFAIVNPGTGQLTRRGELTSNSVFDWGARLSRATDGSVLLVWQSSAQGSLAGTAGDPAALHAALWDGANWSAPTTVVDNLIGVFGWNAAAAGADRATVVLTRDADGQMGTDADRELIQIQRDATGWKPMQPLTSNAVSDWAPQLTYLADGRLALGWLRGDDLVGLVGDLTTPPQVWRKFETNSLPVNPGWCQGQLLALPKGLVGVWPSLYDLAITRWFPSEAAGLNGVPAWTPPEILSLTDGAESAFAAAPADGDNVRIVSALTPLIETPRPHLGEATSVAVNVRSVVPPGPNADTDGDGMSDADEQFAGTDPANPQSVIRLLAVEPVSAGTVRARWRSVVGRSYRLESSGNLGDWQEAAQHTATATESSRETAVPAAETARFFRVVVLPP